MGCIKVKSKPSLTSSTLISSLLMVFNKSGRLDIYRDFTVLNRLDTRLSVQLHNVAFFANITSSVPRAQSAVLNRAFSADIHLIIEIVPVFACFAVVHLEIRVDGESVWLFVKVGISTVVKSGDAEVTVILNHESASALLAC